MASSGASRGNDRRISWSTRLLAPLALVVVLIAVVVVVTGSLAIDDGGDDRPQAATTTAGDGEGDGAETPKEYAVESGDTLSAIAEKFGVSVKRLERLNKKQELDPNALVEGQVVTIR